jgi:hypothetical protein
MKNHLKTLGLALCMLPIYLHAGTGEDLKQTYQEPIPAGTILPVTLNSNLRSDKSASGAAITATLMVDVPLAAGKTLRAGSQLTGHVIEAVTPGRGSDEAKISFQFDDVRLENRMIPITANLRALASVMEVDAAQVPKSGGAEDYGSNWNLVQIGGDQVSYGRGGPVTLGSSVVGESTSQGTLANAQTFWLFSTNASGAYGFGNVRIAHSGSTEPLGEVTLTSSRRAVKVGKGSGMLLRVESSGAGEAQGRSTSSRGTGQ